MAGRGCSSVLASICFNLYVHTAFAYLSVFTVPTFSSMLAGVRSVSKTNSFEDDSFIKSQI